MHALQQHISLPGARAGRESPYVRQARSHRWCQGSAGVALDEYLAGKKQTLERSPHGDVHPGGQEFGNATCRGRGEDGSLEQGSRRACQRQQGTSREAGSTCAPGSHGEELAAITPAAMHRVQDCNTALLYTRGQKDRRTGAGAGVGAGRIRANTAGVSACATNLRAACRARRASGFAAGDAGAGAPHSHAMSFDFEDDLDYGIGAAEPGVGRRRVQWGRQATRGKERAQDAIAPRGTRRILR
eukprot:365525-Chlamydomonas_euryale.AAC.6